MTEPPNWHSSFLGLLQGKMKNTFTDLLLFTIGLVELLNITVLSINTKDNALLPQVFKNLNNFQMFVSSFFFSYPNCYPHGHLCLC